MSLDVRSLEWSHHNEQRRYPFALESTLVDTTGALKIPDNFIVGMTLSVHAGISVKTGNFFIKSLGVYSTGYLVTVGYYTGTDAVIVAQATISKTGHRRGNYYNLYGVGQTFRDCRGFIQIGTLGDIDKQPSGIFSFDFETSRLEPDAIHPFIRGVMSIQARNGLDDSDEYTGRVVIAGGSNVRVRVIEEEGEDVVIAIDAIDGAGLSEDCVCDTDQARPIKTISMVGPDLAGNITLTGDSCLEVEPGEHEIILRDKCSEPCCGCPELQAITRTLENFGSKATTLENILVSLEARTTQTDMVLLGSRLGDRGCVPAPDCE